MIDPQKITEMSTCLRDKAKEMFEDFPKTHPQKVFDAMPQFYEFLKNEKKLLPEKISYDVFYQAAVLRFEVMRDMARFGFF